MEICEEEESSPSQEIGPWTSQSLHQQQEEECTLNDTEEPIKEKIVVFRNRIYRIVHNAYRLYNVYDYFASELEEMRNSNHIMFMFNTEEHSLTTFDSYKEKDCITYTIFQTEQQEIQKEDVPKKALECLLNLQIPKVAEVIPYAEIKHNEDHHLAVVRKSINEFVDTLMQKVCNILQSSKKLIDIIDCPYIESESAIKNGCKIYYKFPNSDGVIRPTFMEYFNYLFNKLYPIPSTEIDYAGWVQSTIYELLCKKYPFLTFNYVGAPKYIQLHLPTKRVLH